MNKVFAVFLKDFRLAMSYKINFVMIFISPLISMLLLFLIITSIMNTNESHLNLESFRSIFYGIIFIDLSFVVISSLPRLINEYRLQGILEETFLSSDLYVIFSSFAWIFVIFSFKSFVYFLIGSLIFKISFLQDMLFIKIVIILLPTFFALMGLSIISASYTIINLKSNAVQTIIMIGSSFLSGAFFPTKLLPDILFQISHIIPITYSINLIKNIHEFSFFSLELLALVLLAIALNFLGYFLVKKSIAKAKKDGMLIYF